MINGTDIEKAKRYRDENECSLVIYKDGKLLSESKDFGIKPLYMVYKDNIDVQGASLADKVIGLGAAMIAVYIGIKEINTFVVSKSAYSYLQNKDIVISYDNIVDFIANRSKDGKCPVETMAETTSNTEELLIKVEQFLKRLDLI